MHSSDTVNVSVQKPRNESHFDDQEGSQLQDFCPIAETVKDGHLKNMTTCFQIGGPNK